MQVKGNKIPICVTSELRQKDYLKAKANKTGSVVLRQAQSQVRANKVSIGDKLAKSIQSSDEQSPTTHIKLATVKFRSKPISVLQVTKVI